MSDDLDHPDLQLTNEVDLRLAAFEDILKASEDDLSVILELMERDHDCTSKNDNNRLRSLKDYLEIALAIYMPPVNFNSQETPRR